MRVLLCIRKDYMLNFAGDSMQVNKTCEYLSKIGVSADINKGDIWDFSSYDIIHLFNLTAANETYQYYKRAVMYKKVIVLSPIYWNLLRYYTYTNDLNNIWLWNKWKPYREEIINNCKMIFPNSILEMELMKKEFKENLKYTVIYNGVDSINNVPYIDFKKKYNLSDYALCVARICERKNQLILSRVCFELGIQLVLIGGINNYDYYKKCIKYKNVVYLGFHNKNTVFNAYKNALFHILPSFVETPGLASLEGAINDCKIISTVEGSAKEYFNSMAIYCNPYEEESICNAVKQGVHMDKNEELKKHILLNFNWEKNIKKLYESYLYALH